MTEVGSTPRYGREFYFPTESTPPSNEGKDWKRVNCTQGIKVLKEGTDPKFRERVLARRRRIAR